MVRSLTANANAEKDARETSVDVLVESNTLNLRYSFLTTTAGGFTWERRILVNGISDIVHEARPGGGLAFVSTLRLLVIDDGVGLSPSALFDIHNELEGADLTLSVLLEGETYANKIILYSGIIESYRQQGMIAEITAVSSTFNNNRLVPFTVIPEGFANPAQDAIGQAVPLVYGNGNDVRFAPMLLTDIASNTYTVADHDLREISGITYGIFNEKSASVKVKTGAATVDSNAATLTLSQALTDIVFGGGLAGVDVGTSIAIQREQDVTPQSATNVIDQNPNSVAWIQTANFFDGNNDGYGFIGVAAAWNDAEGLDTLIYKIEFHRGSPSAAATLNAAITIRVIDATGVVLYNIDKLENLRWSSGGRDTEKELSGLSILRTQKIEVVIEARNEGGSGVFDQDAWIVGEVHITLGTRARGDQEPLYLANNWQGRPDDGLGTYTGTASALIEKPPDVLHNLLVLEFGQSVDTAYIVTARNRLPGWKFGGGIGSGWHQQRLPIRDLIDDLAVQSKSIVFDRAGLLRIFPFSKDDASQYTFTTNEILWAAGTSVDVEPGTRETTFALNEEDVAPVHNVFEIRYAYNAARRQFDKLRFCNPDGTNSTDSLSNDLVTLCLNSSNRHGRTEALIIDAYFIYDDATAQNLLDHLVRYFWESRANCSWESSTQGLHIELGDFVTLNYPDLPTKMQNEIFEIHRLKYRFIPVTAPNGEQALSFRIGYLASRSNKITFDYLVILDQPGTPHYWYIRGGVLVDSLSVPAIAGLEGENMTPVGIGGGQFEPGEFEEAEFGASSIGWLRVDAVDNPATQIYMWPHENQIILVDSSPPANHSEYDVGAGLVMRGVDGASWTLAAHTSFQITITPA